MNKNHDRRLISGDECCIAPAVHGTQREYYPERSTPRPGSAQMNALKILPIL